LGVIVLRFALTLELKFGYAAEADVFWDHADAGSL